MILKSFIVLDMVTKAFLPPFFVRNKGEAIRSFTSACNDKSHQFCKHSHDYILYENGEWDDETGLFLAVEPVRVVSAREVTTLPGSPEVD